MRRVHSWSWDIAACARLSPVSLRGMVMRSS